LNLNQFARKYVKCCLQLMLLVLPLVLAGCGTQQKAEETVPPTELSDSTELVLQFPEDLSEYVIREQSTYDSATTEAFYIKNGDEAIPLFRIDVGNQNLGDWLGVLRTESGNIPVTYTVFTISEEDMASLGEDAEALYTDLMNGFNVILDGIFSDPRFSSEKPIEVGEEESMSMNYWTVNLPDNMWVTENIEDGNYEAVFFSQIQGENVALYTVRIGDVKAETELGLFTIDGEEKPISIGSFDLSEKPNWSSEDYSTAYRMMDTINDVIQQIISSESYSEPGAE